MDDSLATTWNELYVEHERFVHRLAYDLVRDAHLAEDLVQQTWLAAIERPPRTRRSLKGWLATVLRNLATDHFRSQRRPTAEDEPGVERDSSLALAEREEDDLIRQQVFDSLGDLDEIYRAVLGMHYLEGLTLPSVAERLDLPLETVRTRCRRGLQRLRDRLDQKYGSRRPWVAALLPLARRFAPPEGVSNPATAAGTASSTAAHGARLWPLAAVAVGAGALLVWSQLGGSNEGPAPATVYAGSADEADVQLAGGGVPLTGARVAVGSAGALLDEDADEDHRLRGGEVHVAIRTVHADDLAPLEQVRVFFQPETSEVHGAPLVFESDENGWIEIDDLVAGRWTLRPERGPAHVIDLPSRDESEILLAVADGVEAHGRVLDARGEPVPFAQVYATWPDWIRTFPIAQCDAQGNFHVDRLDRRSWLCGGGEHGLGWLFGFDSPLHRGLAAVEVDLLLADEGETVRGVVVDSRKRPVEGASVRAMARSLTTAVPPRLEQEDVLGCLSPHAEVFVTGPDGKFVISGLRPDLEQFRIGAWADGYLAGGKRTSFAEDGPLVIEMEREAVVEGRVKTPQGKPAAYARVRTHIRGQSQPLITRTDAEGNFRLDRLPAGTLAFSALSDRPDIAGYAEQELSLRRGRTTRWNVRLEREQGIVGRATDADGRALVDWIVTLQPECEIGSHRVTSRFDENRLIRRARTDADGRYAFYGCAAEDHLIKLFDPAADDGPGYPRANRWGTLPDSGAADLVVGAAGDARARVRGRLLLESGDAPRAAELSLYSRLLGRSLRGAVTAGSGVFDVGPLPAGTYEIQAWVPPAMPTLVETIELAPGQVIDLGDVVLPEPERSGPRRPRRAEKAPR